MCDSRYSNIFAQTCYTLYPSMLHCLLSSSYFLCELPTLTYVIFAGFLVSSPLSFSLHCFALSLVFCHSRPSYSLEEKKILFQPIHIMDSVHISIVWHFVVLLFCEAKMINIESRASFSFDDSLFTLFAFCYCWCGAFFNIGPLYCDTDSH